MLEQQNPYVGPRTFGRQDAFLFFGREWEAGELYARIVSSRLALFYAESGAGKSSLLHARILPELVQNGYEVLPVARVGGEMPSGTWEIANIFVMNLILSVNQGNTAPEQLEQLSLREFLGKLVVKEDRFIYDVSTEATDELVEEVPPRLLVIDQFEELFTSHPTHWKQRADFFRQLSDALDDDPLLFVLLSMRAEFIALLDPYAQLVPDRFRVRFYMERMDVRSALAAAQKPAELAGRPFAEGVAEALIDNLRRIRVQSEEQFALGQFIEPVQLQLVCYQIWNHLSGEPQAVGEITMVDLERVGDVNMTLSDFYEDAIAMVLQQSSTTTSERQLRSWFESELMTEAGTRSIVYQGTDSTAGLPNEIVHRLQERFLLRAEVRAGGVWIELIHDRFIQPIQIANRRWRETYESPLWNDAQAWAAGDRSSKLLYSGDALRTVRAQFEADPYSFTQEEQAFVQASLRAEAQRTARRRWIVMIAGVTLLVVMAGLTGWALWNANAARTDAEAAQATAEANASVSALRATAQAEALAERSAGDAASSLVPLVADLQAQSLAADETAVKETLAQALPLAETMATNAAPMWETLCRYGVLYGAADQVVDKACEWAVALADQDLLATSRESRGLARALTGDIQGSIADFTFYVGTVGGSTIHENWITRLEAGEEPSAIFDAETLTALKTKSTNP